MNQSGRICDAASDSPARITKTKLCSLTEALGRHASDIARVVGRLKTWDLESDIQPLAKDLASALLQWRATDLSPR